ncbi:MAG: M48 family metallopeptidase [Candidatus Hydrogenedentes bacterium]|nr:M48 family metallopeptidase [Candidatus Hydrogenedentota bacterium]
MWEQIQSNKRKSAVLVVVMLFLLLLLGFALGAAVFPSVQPAVVSAQLDAAHFTFDPTGGILGMIVALVVWGFFTAVAWASGDSILLYASGAKAFDKADHPQLFNVVEEMKIASALPAMPKIYVMNDMSMNAFATGKSVENASVAVTAGLLARMNRDQLQGVIAHEMAHIKNQDVLFMTRLGIMAGAIVILSEAFLRSMWYGGGHSGRRYSSDKRGGGGYVQLILIIVAVLLAILVPILARLIYFAASRRREYLADASAAVFTRYPEGLASALEVLGNDSRPLENANRATAPMFIVNPLDRKGMAAHSLTATHPPLSERIQILRSMAGAASYTTYQSAWNKVSGKGAGHIPGSALGSGESHAIRPPHPDVVAGVMADVPAAARMRAAGDLLRSMNNFMFLNCACGLRIKLPPEFRQEEVECPRCHRKNRLPMAEVAAAAAVASAAAEGSQAVAKSQKVKPIPITHAASEALEVVKKPGQWLTFKCQCGATKNLAPNFSAPRTQCNHCGRIISVREG